MQLSGGSASRAVLTVTILAGLTGCHSAFVNASVTNTTDKPIQLFEVDYPNASFGSSELRSGHTFHYRFKVQGEGRLKATWTDDKGKERSAEGPTLNEGDEGDLVIRLGPQGPSWSTAIHHPTK